MQRQLSSANNSFADFVVKEFKLDAAVQASVNELGVLQFTLADGTMPAHSISRLYLTLAGVAKPADQTSPSWAAADATPLADIPWLPASLVSQLAENDIKTASEFLGLAADARLTAQIVSLLKIERAEMGRWANQIRLLSLPGITTAAIAALAGFKIFAVTDLAQLTNEGAVQLQRRLGAQFPPGAFIKWRDAARDLTGLSPSVSTTQTTDDKAAKS